MTQNDLLCVRAAGSTILAVQPACSDRRCPDRVPSVKNSLQLMPLEDQSLCSSGKAVHERALWQAPAHTAECSGFT